MKKLHLTSFVFTTGENEYKEQRLVVAQSTDEAYKKALAWFPSEFPESTLKSCISHEAIDLGVVVKHEDSPFNHADWHNSDEFPSDKTGEGYSVDVLCDVNGNRKEFRVGWYDFDDKAWQFHDTDRSWLEEKHLKWTYLPLAD